MVKTAEPILRPYLEPPASGNSPIVKLPMELRRKIFSLILASKDVAIVPIQMRSWNCNGTIVLPRRDGMAIPLLLTCRQWCAEMTTLLYEEHEFELGVHPSGIDFLKQPRAPAMGDLPEAMVKSAGQMQHFRVVFYGPNPSDRLATTNMRVSAEKLARLLLVRDIPVISVEVCFGLCVKPFDSKGDFWAHHEKTTTFDEASDKYVTWRKARGSIIHGVTNYELVSAPLKQLRGICRVTFTLPDGCEDPALQAYANEFKGTVESESKPQKTECDTDTDTNNFNKDVDFTDIMTRRDLTKFEGDDIHALRKEMHTHCEDETAKAIDQENMERVDLLCYPNAIEELRNQAIFSSLSNLPVNSDPETTSPVEDDSDQMDASEDFEEFVDSDDLDDFFGV